MSRPKVATRVAAVLALTIAVLVGSTELSFGQPHPKYASSEDAWVQAVIFSSNGSIGPLPILLAEMEKLDQGGGSPGASFYPGLSNCEILATYVGYLENGLQPPRGDPLTPPFEEFLTEMKSAASTCEGFAHHRNNLQLRIDWSASFDAAVGTFIGGVLQAMLLDGISDRWVPLKLGVVW